jgi:hypothetical protein
MIVCVRQILNSGLGDRFLARKDNTPTLEIAGVLLAIGVRNVTRFGPVMRAAELALQAPVLIPEEMLILGQITILELEG